MEKYFLFCLIVLGVLLMVCFVIIYKLYREVSSMKKRQLRLSEKLSGQRAEDLMYNIIEEEDYIKKEVRSIRRDLTGVKEKQNRCFDKIKIVRYPSTSENEAKLSYSVGLTNENGDGLVITGLQYRQGCNMYYKQLKEGVPDYELSKEEQSAINRSNVQDVIKQK